MENLTEKELRVLWLLTEETAKEAEQDSPKQKFHKELSDKLWAAYSEKKYLSKDIPAPSRFLHLLKHEK